MIKTCRKQTRLAKSIWMGKQSRTVELLFKLYETFITIYRPTSRLNFDRLYVGALTFSFTSK